MATLPTLIRKAIGDAGFDLMRGEDGEWRRVGISGTDYLVWILPVGPETVVGVSERIPLDEFATSMWSEVPLPRSAVAAVRCQTAEELFAVLRRVRVLYAQLPPEPQRRFAERLSAVGQTESEMIVKRRVGQDLFREMMMAYWEGRCAVTGLDIPELLRASHAKPWRDCNDRERLDVYNGLLLAVHLDALFDDGWITFRDNGSAVVSPELPARALEVLGMNLLNLRIRKLTDMHRSYLAYHRETVFRIGGAGPTPPRNETPNEENTRGDHAG